MCSDLTKTDYEVGHLSAPPGGAVRRCHAGASDKAGVHVRAAGRMRDESTVPPGRAALTCGGGRPEQATSAVLGPERSRDTERPSDVWR